MQYNINALRYIAQNGNFFKNWKIEYFYLNIFPVNLYILWGMYTLCGDNYLK